MNTWKLHHSIIPAASLTTIPGASFTWRYCNHLHHRKWSIKARSL